MSNPPLIIGTRGSALALVQANAVLRQCRALFPDRAFELRIIKTTGDKLQTASMASGSLPKGLFTKELEVALLGREVDFAVHSLKDLPTELPEGLVLGAVGKREDVRDVLLCRIASQDASSANGKSPASVESPLTLRGLRKGAVVATSSTRRAAQITDLRPDIKTVPIRGNVGTRIRKLLENLDWDATVLAAAGLHRLGFQVDSNGVLSGGPAEQEPVPPGKVRVGYLAVEEMLPCVGQAAIGIEVRAEDPSVAEVCSKLNDPITEACVVAERAFLSAMGGGCQAAVAALAVFGEDSNRLRMNGVSYLGSKPIRALTEGASKEAARLGVALADRLKAGQ